MSKGRHIHKREKSPKAPAEAVHGPNEPCTCPGCWACAGHVIGCTCDIDWDGMRERQMGQQ